MFLLVYTSRHFFYCSNGAEEHLKWGFTWVQDGAGAASAGPGQRIQTDGPPVQRHRARSEHLTNFDPHFCVTAFVLSRQHTCFDHCHDEPQKEHSDASAGLPIKFPQAKNKLSHRSHVCSYTGQTHFSAVSPCTCTFLRDNTICELFASDLVVVFLTVQLNLTCVVLSRNCDFLRPRVLFFSCEQMIHVWDFSTDGHI